MLACSQSGNELAIVATTATSRVVARNLDECRAIWGLVDTMNLSQRVWLGKAIFLLAVLELYKSGMPLTKSNVMRLLDPWYFIHPNAETQRGFEAGLEQAADLMRQAVAEGKDDEVGVRVMASLGAGT
jgi:hypothetical protein